MKKSFFILVAILFLCCEKPAKEENSKPEEVVSKEEETDNNDQTKEETDSEEPAGNEEQPTVTTTRVHVSFKCGSALTSGYNNIYVVWMENKTKTFLQNMSICQKLIKGGLTGTALPYWKVNKYPRSDSDEIDAVTSETIAKKDFTVSADIKDSTVKTFTLYFETDHSFDANDWFSDQPAVLYAVDINLEDSIARYEMLPLGWTPNEKTEGNIPETSMGVLQSEIRYITHTKIGDSFGVEDENSSLQIVDEITVTLEK